MEYFTLYELYYSNTAKKLKINNTPDNKIMKNLQTMIRFLNPLREKWGSPINISSGYRCNELNKAVGGVSTSAHLIGCAVDLVPSNGEFDKFVEFMKNYLVGKQFDQCIIEKSRNSRWVHFGLYNQQGMQRKQLFNLCVNK